MGLRFSHRVRLGRSTGVNISGSGLSASIRGKYGSFGTRGYSIRTRIPGLSFRQSWGVGKSKGLEALMLILFVGAAFYIVYNLIVLAAVIVYNVLLFIFAILKGLYRFLKINWVEQKFVWDYDNMHGNPEHLFVKLTGRESDRDLEQMPLYLDNILVKNGEYLQKGEPACMVGNNGVSVPMHLNESGFITWYKLQGQQLVEGHYIARIEYPGQ